MLKPLRRGSTERIVPSMKTFLLVLIALVAAVASGYYVLQGIDGYSGAGAESSSSSSAVMLDTSMEMKSSMRSSVQSDITAPVKSGASYLAYTDGVIGNGERAVLFFHAAWCPYCRIADADLKAIYEAGGAGMNTYRVDYDTSLELKKKYGVTYQHTFVVIDGQGNAEKTVQGATKTQLEALLK